ncbi:MAG: hypothetical protein ACREP5_03605, partial [Candidatus Binatia bacterium]
VTEIRHWFRVTVRATNGYVYPASHRAGSTSGALPMGARLRLKASVDVTQRTSDPNLQNIFRAMQKYGLIVADNGSDMYITGTYDTRWNNDVLNPAFRNLTVSDFEVIQLGYNPTVAPASLSSVSVNPSAVTGGQAATGTVSLSGAAPSGGAVVNLSSANPPITVPASITVPATATSANFPVTTTSVTSTTVGNVTASYGGVTKSTTLTVNPPAPAALSGLSLNPKSVRGGMTSMGTITLTAPAPAGDMTINVSSSNPSKASVPATVKVLAGNTSANFTITTASVNKRTIVTITASAAGVTKTATLTLVRR